MNNAYLFFSFIALFNSTSSSPQSVPILVSSYLLPAFLDTVYILFLSSFYHSLKTDTVATLRYCAQVNTSSYMKWRYALSVIHSVEEHPAGKTLPLWSTHSVVGRVRQKFFKKRVCVKPNTQIGIDRKKWTSEYNILCIKRRKRKKETKNEKTLLCYIKWFLSVFNKLSSFSPRADDFLSGSKDEKNSFIVLDFCRFRAGQPGYVLDFLAILSFFISILKLYRYFPFFFTIYLSFPLFPPFFFFYKYCLFSLSSFFSKRYFFSFSFLRFLHILFFFVY